ncbi:MAG: hypothetical protein AB7G17_07645 [Phycisphaerales bacterium]
MPVHDVALTQLWLPILLSAIGVFVASSVIWMFLPIHKNDYKKFPDEEAVMSAVRAQNAGPGLYFFPFCKHGPEMKDPVFLEKMKAGPWGTVILFAGQPNMGKTLPLWLINNLILATVSAYVVTLAAPAGADFMTVFIPAAIATLLGYAGGTLTTIIWKGEPASNAIKSLLDAVVYAAITGAIFAAMWPKPEVGVPGLPTG